MSDGHDSSTVRWWAAVAGGVAASLLLAWLGRLAGVPLATLLSFGAAAAALAWMIALATVPWNLYFGARQVVAEIAVSRERGIIVAAAQDAEAGRIARRMMWCALGGHLGTAVLAVAVTYFYFGGAAAGYYVAGFYLLSTAVRPAGAYLAHLRDRITALSRESRHPRADVISLTRKVDGAAGALAALRADLRRTESALAGDIAHARQLLTTDLARLQDAQETDRAAARSRDDDLGRRIDQMVRRIEATLDGISDHQELLTGLRALVRMIRSDPA
jgi:hypothetical protein